MPECVYCGESFEGESAYLEHLRVAHEDDLGPIDRRRVATNESHGLPTGPLAIVAIVTAAVVVIAYVVFFVSGGSAADDGPSNVGSVHYHGTIELIVDGESVDFSQPEYQYRNTGVDAFHFEAGEGTRWHVHAQRVTLAWAMDSLDIDVTDSTVTFEGITYDDEDPNTTVNVTVDGESVNPSEYVLQEGDAVRIIVEVG